MKNALIDLFTLEENLWIAHTLITLAVTCIAAFFVSHLLRQLQKQFKKTKTFWDDAALAAVRTPALVLVWLLGLNFTAHILSQQAHLSYLKYASSLREILVIAIIAWFLMRFISRAEGELIRGKAGRAATDPTSVHAIAKLSRISVVILAVLILLEKLGYSITGVMAFGGIGGIAVGFAAKDMLANFFGGLMIFLDRPFSVGDWIRSPDREIEGTVEQIGWRQTQIRTPEKRLLYIPNSIFSSIAVENPSRMSHRRLTQTLGLRYDDWKTIPIITQRIHTLLEAHPEIDNAADITVNLSLFNASSIDITLVAYTQSTNGNEFSRIRQDILLNIMQIVQEEGADFAFPTQTVLLTDTANNTK